MSRNAVVLGVPSRLGLVAARDKVRDHLAWQEVKKLLEGARPGSGAWREAPEQPEIVRRRYEERHTAGVVRGGRNRRRR